MKQYKLVNENRGNEIIAMLEDILAGDIFNKLDKAPKLLTKIIFKTKNGKEFKSYKESVEIIKELHHKQSSVALNHYLADRYLSFDQAALCMLGLNPMAVSAIGNNPRVINRKIKGVILKRFIMETAECRGLSKAPGVEEKSGFISDAEDKVYTDGFISWAIDQGIIAIINGKGKKNNINKFNSERVDAKEHNKQVIIDAFYKYKSKSDSINSFMDNNKYYEKYKSDLVPMFEDGELPKKSTLRDYLYDSEKKKT
jgi:DNA mismatch repair ATPase MutS